MNKSEGNTFHEDYAACDVVLKRNSPSQTDFVKSMLLSMRKDKLAKKEIVTAIFLRIMRSTYLTWNLGIKAAGL